MFSNYEPLQAHILQCTQKTSSYMEYEISCTFYMLLTNLLIAKSKTRNTSEVIEKIVSYIQANYMKNLTIDNLSHLFGISRTHMTRCFKDYTGFAPHEYITQLRIYNAKYLLKTTNLSIEEIRFLRFCLFHSGFQKNRRHHAFHFQKILRPDTLYVLPAILYPFYQQFQFHFAKICCIHNNTGAVPCKTVHSPFRNSFHKSFIRNGGNSPVRIFFRITVIDNMAAMPVGTAVSFCKSLIYYRIIARQYHGNRRVGIFLKKLQQRFSCYFFKIIL